VLRIAFDTLQEPYRLIEEKIAGMIEEFIWRPEISGSPYESKAVLNTAVGIADSKACP
jgi:hypothetical protein